MGLAALGSMATIGTFLMLSLVVAYCLKEVGVCFSGAYPRTQALAPITGIGFFKRIETVFGNPRGRFAK